MVARLMLCVAAGLALGACSKIDKSPRPEGSAVAAAMPDAASTPTAQGPATAAPHGTPPPGNYLPPLGAQPPGSPTGQHEGRAPDPAGETSTGAPAPKT